MATAFLAVAQAWLLGTAISSAFRDGAGLGGPNGLQATLAALAAVLVARAAVSWGQEYVARRCSASVKSSLRLKLLRRAADLSARRGEVAGAGPSSGEVVALATRGLDALDAYFARYLPQLVLAGIVPLTVIVCLATADLVAAATVALTVPLIPIFMVLIGSATERRRRRRWDALARLSGHFLDVVAGLPTLRVFGRAEAQLERLERVTDEYRRESLGTLRVAFLSAFALELAATISVALVAVGVGLRLVDGALDLRTGLFVVILAPEAYLPLRQLGASFHSSEEGLAAAAAAFRIIEAPEPVEPGDEPARRPVPDLRGADIRFEAVTVRQPGRSLEAPFEASFVLRPGEVTGIAGPSGAGKSTLVDVLLGLRRADEGRVAIVPAAGAPTDTAAFDPADWHGHISWVPQLPYCFPGTVAENVRLAAPKATDAQVIEALTAVGLAGLDAQSPLGEGGSGVSSGQRRRIGVARALLRDAPILILDEPTAGLDELAEAAVLQAVLSAARDQGRAVMLVAHRPAALSIADRVVTIESRSTAEAAS